MEIIVLDTLLKQLVSSSARGHRNLLTVSLGSVPTSQALDFLAAKLISNRRVLLSEISEHQDYEVCTPKQAPKYLGQQIDLLVVDLDSANSALALAALVGCIRAGGSLVFMVADLDAYATRDAYCARLVSHLDHCADVKQLIVELSENQSSMLGVTQSNAGVEWLNPQAVVDQERVIAAMLRVANGHARRPFLLEADRGRGKSTALITAAQQLREQGKHCVITSLESSYTRRLCQEQELEFCALERLLAEHQSCDVLFVDEAASISPAQLIRLVERYNRLVLVTTVSGYEGSGNGFNLKFKQALSELRPQWRAETLSLPMRWAEDDPVEQFVADLLLLQSDAMIAEAVLPDHSHVAPQLTWLDKNQGINEQDLRHAYGLLKTAHYQTSPADLEYILADDAYRLGMFWQGTELVGVVCVVLEHVSDQTLVADIICGTRRPKGGLLSQTLAKAWQQAQFLQQPSWRIVRIGIQPDRQQQGLGRQLLSALEQQACAAEVAYLSTSFGFSAQLGRFWQGSQFCPMYLSYRTNRASGLYSLMLVKPLNQALTQTTSAISALLYQNILQTLDRYWDNIGVANVLALAQYYQSEGGPTSGAAISQYALNKLRAFAAGNMQWEQVSAELVRLLQAELARLSDQEAALIERALMNHSVASLMKRYQCQNKVALHNLLAKQLQQVLGRLALA